MKWKLEVMYPDNPPFEVYGLSENGYCYAKEFIKNSRRGNASGAKSLLRKLDSLALHGRIPGDRAFEPVRKKSNLYEIKVKKIRLFGFLHNEKTIILMDGVKKSDGDDAQTAAILKAERMRDEYLKSLPE